jgi:hypothetical protein
MYKYSKQAEERFLVDADLAFFVLWVEKKPDFNSFLLSKID